MPPKKKDPAKNVNVRARVEPDVKRRVAKLAKEMQANESVVVRQAIIAFLDREDAKEAKQLKDKKSELADSD